MSNNAAGPENDVWSNWLLHHRHGGDAVVADLVSTRTGYYADRVLNGAQLSPGMTLVDVGTGDGLVAFEAIKRVGPVLTVILTDISTPLLRHVEQLANRRRVENQCHFLECSAENLEGIGNGSVDVVVTRAVLAYVSAKATALGEFFRVLKPGGRISICEPIMRDQALVAFALRQLIDAQPVESRDRFLELQCRLRSLQFGDTIEGISANPITNFTEGDLVRFAHDAGFVQVHLELHSDTDAASVTTWDAFLASSPHPWAPPVGRIMADHFTVEERNYFEEKFRPLLEAGQSKGMSRNAFLTARKPNADFE